MFEPQKKPIKETPAEKKARQLKHAYDHKLERVAKAMLKQNQKFLEQKRTIKKRKGRKPKYKTPQQRYTLMLDDLVREIIKLRDDACYCGKPRGSTRLVVGHLIKRGKRMVRWDLTNVHASCDSCNKLHNTYPESYELWFMRNYSSLDYQLLLARSQQTFNYMDVPKVETYLREALAQLQALAKGEI